MKQLGQCIEITPYGRKDQDRSQAAGSVRHRGADRNSGLRKTLEVFTHGVRNSGHLFLLCTVLVTVFATAGGRTMLAQDTTGNHSW